jgi:hypothetical protein
MKNLLPLLALFAASVVVHAQEKPTPPGPPPPGQPAPGNPRTEHGFRPDRGGFPGGENRDGRGRFFGPPGGEGPDRPMQRWLESRREQNPEEFDRLKRLHEENPEEFRRQLGQRLLQERVRRAAQNHPEVRAALDQVPPEKQKAFFQDLMDMHGGGLGEPGGFRPERGPDTSGAPDRKAGFQEVQTLVQQHRAATSPADKERLAGELRAKVGDFYRRRVKEREDQIASMEQEILKARREVEEQAKTSDQAIEGRVQSLLTAP